MGFEGRRVEEVLLDWHLNALSPEERDKVEAELLRDPDLRRKSDRLRQVLRPLDYWTMPSAPAGLIEKVVGEAERRAVPAGLGPAEPDGRGRVFPFVRMRELVAVAACLVALIGVAIPGAAHMREQARQAVCASNLGSVAQGLSLYQAAFSGSLPYAGGAAGAAWLPAAAENAPYVSNSRHLFLLAKFNFVPRTGHFVCPSNRGSEAMDATLVAASNDFARARNISYASLNLCGKSPHLQPKSRVAYVSDVNPLFVGGRFDERVNPMEANSPSHRGRGQTVLALDGTVERVSSPFFGQQKDNLWLAGDIRRYTGMESPTCDNDAFLVQGFPVTDLANFDSRTR